MVKAAANPGVLPLEIIAGFRQMLGANLAWFYLELANGPFFGYDRPDANVSQGAIQNWWRQAMMGGAKAHLDGIKAFSETDFTEDLKRVDVPTLVVHGDADQTVPIDASARLSSKLLKRGTLKSTWVSRTARARPIPKCSLPTFSPLSGADPRRRTADTILRVLRGLLPYRRIFNVATQILPRALGRIGFESSPQRSRRSTMNALGRRTNCLVECASAFLVAAFLGAGGAADSAEYSWRYYRPSNTGIQGDFCDAIWIGDDGDPWIGGYVPSFEEGGVAKFLQSENRWINISNVDHPVIGHPNLTGTTRVAEIVADAEGTLWMGTGRGVLKFDPSIGPDSLVNFNVQNSGVPGGWVTGVELAPDGTLWFSAYSTSWGAGGLRRLNPTTNVWTAFPGYGDGSLAVQPKKTDGYFVWATQVSTGQIARYDSTTGAWTSFTPVTNAPWGLPGKACTDDEGNTWMLRLTGPSPALQTLDCRRPDGSWIGTATPPLPATTPPIWAFRAFGDRQALLVDGNSQTWRFNGIAWQNLGIWRPGAFTEDVQIDDAGNVWVCGSGGAAKRDVTTGVWQRYRVSNTSQYDFFNNDLSIDQATGTLYACANAGSGIGGMVTFDGARWTGVNDAQYGLGISWPFPTDNSSAVSARPSLGAQTFAVSPMFNGLRQFNAPGWSMLLANHTSKGMVEDSLGRLWSIGEYFNLGFHDGSAWHPVSIACWGSNVQRDNDRPGTVWACANCEVVRTDGVYRWSRENTQLPGLNPQSDVLTTVAAGRDGVAWVGSTKGVHRLDAEANTVQHFPPGTPWLQGGVQIEPRAVTPDGRLWFTNFGSGNNPTAGLAWYDGTDWGKFPGPVPSGAPQWGGLPHAQIYAVQTRELANGYELWMSCPSRGIAVLTVTLPTALLGDLNGDGIVDGADLGMLLGAWGRANSAADLDGDGTVGGADLGILLAAWTG